MINELQDLIVEALQAEQGAGGRLEGVKTIFKVSRDLVQTRLYPLISVDWKGDLPLDSLRVSSDGTVRLEEAELTFDLALETESPLAVEEATCELQGLILDLGSPPTGLVPTLARIQRLQVSTGQYFVVESRLARAGLRGTDKRAVAVALFELRLTALGVPL